MAFRKIAFSTAIMSSVTIFRMLAQLLVVPFLSRLLSPADYGLVATWEQAIPPSPTTIRT